MNAVNEKVHDMLDNLKNDSSYGIAELINKVFDIIKYQLETIINRDKDIKYEFMELSEKSLVLPLRRAPLINSIGYLVKILCLITTDYFFLRIKKVKKELPIDWFSNFLKRND